MKIKCEYCESFIDDTETSCPNCGATNENMKRVANGVPTTIEELKDYCVEHNLPISMMRFYIGENYKLPKAYGIYKDLKRTDNNYQVLRAYDIKNWNSV